MPVSKHAAAAVPTKLGLKSGSSITVENAIKAIVTLSANDMARVIAEYISGSESAFAERMTSTAKALGMKRTTYRNASGLPDSQQVTTVRDQAILGIAVYQHSPSTTSTSRPRASATASAPTATTTGCWASAASTASRPATPMPRASTC
jgi:D-alanyl-D-alanine carboxypeptidase